ncbi:MAG: hypothetical protein RR733_04905 [Victivallaceae bacterium]
MFILVFLSSTLLSVVICLIVTMKRIDALFKRASLKADEQAGKRDETVFHQTESLRKYTEKQINGIWTALDVFGMFPEKTKVKEKKLNLKV